MWVLGVRNVSTRNTRCEYSVYPMSVLGVPDVSTRNTRVATQPDALVFVDGRLVHETTGGSFAVPMAALPPGTMRVLTGVLDGVPNRWALKVALGTRAAAREQPFQYPLSAR